MSEHISGCVFNQCKSNKLDVEIALGYFTTYCNIQEPEIISSTPATTDGGAQASSTPETTPVPAPTPAPTPTKSSTGGMFIYGEFPSITYTLL
jgi:hypothetical protein